MRLKETRLKIFVAKNFVAVLVVLAAVVFFALIAFSSLDNYLKAFFLLIDLIACGALLKRLTGIEGYYGLLLLRGEKGFRTMQWVANHFPKESRFLADWGFTVGFGVPYALFAFRKQSGKRRAVVSLAAIAFQLFFFFSQFASASSGLNSSNALVWLTLLVLLSTGLFGTGFLLLAQHAFEVLTIPGTAPGVTLLLPFVTVPWEAVFAIVIIMIVHELAHGVLCYIEKLRVKSSGLLLFGFLPIGAFVEPDEKQLSRTNLLKKRRILAVGSASNLLFFMIFLALAASVTFAVQQTISKVVVEKNTLPAFANGEAITAVDGIQIRSAEQLSSLLVLKAYGGNVTSVFETSAGVKQAAFARLVVQKIRVGSPASGVLKEKQEIKRVNGMPVADVVSLRAALSNAREGDVVVLETSEGVKRVTLGPGGKLGVELGEEIGFEARNVPREGFAWLYALLSFLAIVFFWTYSLNFILAVVNLLPIVITDGQRIVFEEARAKFGKKNGLRVSLAFSAIALALLVLNALPWFLK